MNNDLETLEKERKSIYRKQVIGARIAVPLVVIGILCMILGIILMQQNETEMGFFIVVLVGVALIVSGVIINSVLYKKSNPFRKQFKQQVVSAMLRKKYEKVTYLPESGIAISEFLASGLVKNPDRYQAEDLVTGSYRGVNFKVSDFKLEERHVEHSKHGTRVYYTTYFLGRFFVFRFDEKYQAQVRIIEKSFLFWGLKPSSWHIVETESIAFNKKFQVATSDEQHAFYILTPHMIEKILRLEMSYAGNLSMLWRGNQLFVAINDSKNAFEPKMSRPLTESGLKYYQNEINIMGDMIDQFGLYRDKFMNGD